MLEKIKKWAIIALCCFIAIVCLMAWSIFAPEAEEIPSPCPDCNVTISCPPCPESPDVYVSVPSVDLTVPVYTEAEIENITLNYISNLRGDPRTWFEVKEMSYGQNGNWTVRIKYECPGQGSARTFIVIFNEPTGKCF